MDPSASSVEAWSARLGPLAVPVLRSTRLALDSRQRDLDRVDANMLADLVLRDPLMCLRVLVQAARNFGHRLATPAATVTAALVLMGIEPFFRDFSGLPTVEERLARRPAALAAVLAAVQRSHCAARLAAAFAIHRHDADVELLHQAALLDNFAGLLVWCEAPQLALAMLRRQRADPLLRSADVQRAVLGVELGALAQRLMELWELPGALRELAHPGQGARAGPRTVRLAVQIARHLEMGWHNAALPDDFSELGALLNMPPGSAAALVRDVVR